MNKKALLFSLLTLILMAYSSCKRELILKSKEINNSQLLANGISVTYASQNPGQNKIVFAGTTANATVIQFTNNTLVDTFVNGLSIFLHGAYDSVRNVRIYNSEGLQLGAAGVFKDSAFFNFLNLGEIKIPKGQSVTLYIKLDLTNNAAGNISAGLYSYLTRNSSNEILVSGIDGNSQLIQSGAPSADFYTRFNKESITIKSGQRIFFDDSLVLSAAGALRDITIKSSNLFVDSSVISSPTIIIDGQQTTTKNWTIVREYPLIHFYFNQGISLGQGVHRLQIGGKIIGGNNLIFTAGIYDGDITILDYKNRSFQYNTLPAYGPYCKIKL